VPLPARPAFALAAFAALGAPFFVLALGARLDPTELALWRTIAMQLSFCGVACGFALSLGGGARERLGLVRGRLSAYGLLLAAVGTLALSGALQFAVDALALAPGTSLERLDELVRSAAPRRAGLALLAFCIAPSLGEELLFRGALQRSLERAMGGWCVPFAALAFGALHFDLVHSPAAFVLGCALGAVARSSRSTWTAIASHFANNCAASLPQLGLSEALPSPGSWLGAAVWLAASGVLLAAAAREFRASLPGRAISSD
jgi:membrane protease YdiL (CAAX protease family)